MMYVYILSIVLIFGIIGWFLIRKNHLKCPRCGEHLTMMERVARRGKPGLLTVTDKYKCTGCGEGYAKKYETLYHNQYVGIWHGGKDQWGVKYSRAVAPDPRMITRHDGGYTNVISVSKEDAKLEKYDLNTPEEPLQNEYEMMENSSITVSKIFNVLLLILSVLTLFLLYGMFCQ